MNRMIISIFVLMILSAQAFAVTGIVEGTVTDADTGQPLPGANVILKDTDCGAAADQSGFFVIENVPAGEYVLILQPGFEAVEPLGNVGIHNPVTRTHMILPQDGQ